AFDAYPHLWGLTRPDTNIDHRRVPDPAAVFRRNGTTLPGSARAAPYPPGGNAAGGPASGGPHTRAGFDPRRGGRLLVVHNIGAGARVEDVLFRYELTGRFRYALPPETSPAAARAD